MNKGWENCYVGLPYLKSGRTREGVDCWGLVRLVHKEQMGADLPSFTNEENPTDTIKMAKEGWDKVLVEQSGDVVLFNIFGQPAHVGIIVRPGYFLHAYENQDVRVERLDSPKWSKRKEGIYRYNSTSTSANLYGICHPLRTQKFEGVVEAGKTLQELHAQLKEGADVSTEYESSAVIYVNSTFVPKDRWGSYVVKTGDRIEYRAIVAGGGGGGLLKMAAVLAVAFYAPTIATSLYGAMGGTYVAASAGTYLTALTVGVNLVGGLLINSIFPVRPPNQDSAQAYANEQGKPSWFLQGGNNQVNKYGAIPVVLGKIRFTPPVACETYYEAENTNSYLRSVLCWGYGPLEVDNITIANDPLSNFEEVEIETLQGYATDNRERFDTLYGQDVEQQRVGVTLTNNKTSVVSASRSGNIVTVNLNTEDPEHTYLIGQNAALYSGATLVVEGEILSVPTGFSFTFSSGG